MDDIYVWPGKDVVICRKAYQNCPALTTAALPHFGPSPTRIWMILAAGWRYGEVVGGLRVPCYLGTCSDDWAPRQKLWSLGFCGPNGLATVVVTS